MYYGVFSTIKIFSVDTKDQIADALTKPLAQKKIQRHRRFMCSKSPSQATKVRECYVMSTLVLVFMYMFRSIVISSKSSKRSAQFHQAIRKCKSRQHVLFLERENTL